MHELESFFDYLKFEKRYSSHTLLAYRKDLEQLDTYLFNQYDLQPVHLAQAIHIRSWIVYLIEKKISPRSINRKISSVKSYFKFAMRKKWILKNPMYKIISPKTSRRLPEYIEEKDMQYLLEQLAFPPDFAGKRDKIIIELFYATGMRLSELLHLQNHEIDLHTAQIKVLGKGNKERILPIDPKLISNIKEYQTLRATSFPEAPQDFILTDDGQEPYPKWIYNKVKYYLTQITTLTKKSPHILRHTFATHLLNKGADINAIKELLGHSSLAATQVYTHNSIEKLKDIHKQAHPRA